LLNLFIIKKGVHHEKAIFYLFGFINHFGLFFIFYAKDNASEKFNEVRNKVQTFIFYGHTL